MTPISLRPAREDELPSLDAWSYDFERDDGHPPAQDPGPPFLSRTWAAFRDEPSRGEVLVIDDGARAIGYVVLVFYWSNEFRGVVALLDELYLAPSHRGGRGGAVLDAIAARLTARDVAAVSLEVLDANPRVASLYARHGFRSDRRAFVRRLRAQ